MYKEYKTYKVYAFSELSDEAKETAKRWYLDDEFRCQELTSIIQEDLANIFPESDLEVQWSLCSRQGDGVNLYGKLDLSDVFSMMENGCAAELDWIKGYLTEKDIKTMKFYIDQYKSEIELPINRRYAYCMSDQIDLAEDFQYELETMGIRDVNIAVLEKAEKMVKQIISQLCIGYEKMGYDYLYEISDEDMEENCEANNYRFLKDGTWFNDAGMDRPKELKEYAETEDGWSCDLFEKTDKDTGAYQVIFEYADIRYYCHIYAQNFEKALVLFFANHPHITYEMIVDHMEI